MDSWGSLIAGVYAASLFLLAAFGVHRYLLLALYIKHRRNNSRQEWNDDFTPPVTIQLPIYNEKYVVERLLESVALIRYPAGKMEIQVLDDSTDETAQRLEEIVERLQGKGHDIKYIHRSDRQGYKAGALQAGLETASGELVAVFDADFTPDPSFLEDVVPQFQNEDVGMVQTRWSHINRNHSLLTRIQSILLDGHFIIEHSARSRSGRFFNFNGTAGIWRKEAIQSAGGWQADTLTEDLDLSYRAQLKGWKFIYLEDVTSPAELPVEMNAYKSQQHRWAKGSIQTALKLLPTIWRSPLPFKVKAEATVHLSNNIAYAIMVVPAFLMLPMLMLHASNEVFRVFFIYSLVWFASTISVVVFYLSAEWRATGQIRRHLAMLPCLMSLGIGMSLNNARAVFEALARKHTPFLRTPKYAVVESGSGWKRKSYRGRFSVLSLLEVALALYFMVSVVYAFYWHLYLAVPILLLFLFGFSYVGGLSIFQRA